MLKVDYVKAIRIATNKPAAAGGLVGMVKNSGTGGKIDNCKVTVENYILAQSNGSNPSCAAGAVGMRMANGRKQLCNTKLICRHRPNCNHRIKVHGFPAQSQAGGYVGYANGNIKNSRSYVEGTIKSAAPGMSAAADFRIRCICYCHKRLLQH